MKIDITLKNNREVEYSNTIIGKTYENEATTLKFNLPEEMIDKNFYIEFEKTDGTKLSTPKLDIKLDDSEIIKTKGTVEYKIPNSLLDIKGDLKVEVVLRDNDNLVFKTYTMKFTILNSINASEEIPEQYPDFVSEAQKVIDLIKNDGTGEKYLSDDGTYKEVSGGSGFIDITNNDSTNKIPFRNLESGTYYLKGYYTSYTDSTDTIFLVESYAFIVKNDNNSYVFILTPYSGVIKYYNITDNSMTVNSIQTSLIQEKKQIVLNDYSTRPTIVLNDNVSNELILDLKKLTISLPTDIEPGYETLLKFNSGTTATTFICEDTTIKWSGEDVNNNVFTPTSNKHYEIEIYKDNFGTFAKVIGGAI